MSPVVALAVPASKDRNIQGYLIAAEQVRRLGNLHRRHWRNTTAWATHRAVEVRERDRGVRFYAGGTFA